MAKKEFFISAVQMVDVEGSVNIPTVLYYQTGGRPLIGFQARAGAATTTDILNEDFKVDLGNSDPTSSAPRRKFHTSQPFSKTAADLTSDFLHELLRYTNTWLEERGYAKSPSILLAEPLAMQTGLVQADWLSNYRRNLQRILFGKSFSSIDFLPEPFAVFQYYRYGLRHPLVAERIHHNALVIDFGGGTFDVCVISTTREGDISQTGRNSKPLAAASIPIGGFYLNRLIAQNLFRKHYFDANKSRYKKAAEAYHRWLKSGQDEDLNLLAPENLNFVLNLHRTTYLTEDLKLTLCRNIPHWSLTDTVPLTAPIAIPADPYSDDGRTISAKYASAELRTLFETQVWNTHLKPIVERAFQRAHDELQGAPISVVLLSGGSANIGWLRHLLLRDFANELNHAEVLNLPDFQEVVAKGLAVECARRFSTPEGDFASVTYNRLCLILDPDGSGPRLTRYQPRMEDLPHVNDMPGVLLPSASILGRFVGRQMLWKFHLERPPRQRLEYFFLRSSFDPVDIENLQNIEEQRLHTPRGCLFDHDLKLQLTVQEDGTARPRFIYKSGRTEEETVAVEGRPFFLDMTFGKSSTSSKAYIGLDFGTSNSAVSFVSDESVALFRQRSGQESWRGLGDLALTLPYPLAEPLGRYLSQTDPTRLTKTALEFVEAAMAFMAYATLCDYRLHEMADTRLFKVLTQRSVGPLWALLRETTKNSSRLRICRGLNELVHEETHRYVDEAVTFFGQYKHDKAREGGIDILRVVQTLANLVQLAFSEWVFGFFETVQRRPFSSKHVGRFRQACGTPPFSNLWEYEGNQTFSEDQAILVNSSEHLGLSLEPFVFWDQCQAHPEQEFGHCYLFDRAERGRD